MKDRGGTIVKRGGGGANLHKNPHTSLARRTSNFNWARNEGRTFRSTDAHPSFLAQLIFVFLTDRVTTLCIPLGVDHDVKNTCLVKQDCVQCPYLAHQCLTFPCCMTMDV